MKSAQFIRIISVCVLLGGVVGARAQQPAAAGALNDQLIAAARSGNTALVQQLLQKGANIEARDTQGETALTMAAWQGKTDTVKFLIEKGAKVDAKNMDGQTALMLATWTSSTGTAEVLLRLGANVNADDGSGGTALRLAANNVTWAAYRHDAEAPKLLRLLLDKGANLEARDKHGATILMHYAKSGHTDLVKLFLERGARIEAQDSSGDTALIYAVEADNPEAVHMLLDRGAYFEGVDNEGRTPLMRALEKGSSAAAATLLNKGANVHVADKKGCTALFYAVKYILRVGARIQARELENGKAGIPLIVMAEAQVAIMVLDRGANFDAKDNLGNTILTLTTATGRSGVVLFLASHFVEHGNLRADREDYDRAIVQFNRALRLVPDYAEAFRSRGVAYRKRGEVERALQDLEQALRLKPDYAGAFRSRAIAYSDKGDYGRAVQDYSQAIRLEPKDKWTLAARGIALFYCGRFAAAREDLALRSTGELYDLSPAIWLFLARARSNPNAREEARAELSSKSLSMDLKDWPGPVVRFYLGSVNAEALLAAAKSEDPKWDAEKHCEAYFFLGEDALLGGHPLEAKKLFQQAVATGVRNSYAYHGAKAELYRIDPPAH